MCPNDITDYLFNSTPYIILWEFQPHKTRYHDEVFKLAMWNTATSMKVSPCLSKEHPFKNLSNCTKTFLWMNYSLCICPTLIFHPVFKCIIHLFEYIPVERFTPFLKRLNRCYSITTSMEVKLTVAFLMAVRISIVLNPPRGSMPSNVRPNVSWKM